MELACELDFDVYLLFSQAMEIGIQWQTPAEVTRGTII